MWWIWNCPAQPYLFVARKSVHIYSWIEKSSFHTGELITVNGLLNEENRTVTAMTLTIFSLSFSFSLSHYFFLPHSISVILIISYPSQYKQQYIIIVIWCALTSSRLLNLTPGLAMRTYCAGASHILYVYYDLVCIYISILSEARGLARQLAVCQWLWGPQKWGNGTGIGVP